jgi:hypothetical protein
VVPAEPRPPEPVTVPRGLPPEAEIGPIPPPPPPRQEDPFLDPRFFIAPIGARPKAAPLQPLQAVPSWALGKFSIPVILDLEKGRYYVQVGAYRRHDTLNNATGRIDKTYPLKVQVSGNESQPLYRLVIGPLNEGEAQAHLQRFKKTGYDDAFIRMEF